MPVTVYEIKRGVSGHRVAARCTGAHCQPGGAAPRVGLGSGGPIRTVLFKMSASRDSVKYMKGVFPLLLLQLLFILIIPLI